MCSKFSNINNQLLILKHDLKVSMEDLVSESLSIAKDFIIGALLEDNAKLHQMVENLGSRISVLQYDSNKQDQYNRCNNLDIQGRTARQFGKKV